MRFLFTSPLAKDVGHVSAIGQLWGCLEEEMCLSLLSCMRLANQPPLRRSTLTRGLRAFRKPTVICHQSLFALLKVRKQHFNSPTCPRWGLFWSFPGAPWPAWAGVLSAFINSQHSCPGCGWLGPSWPPVAGLGGAVGRMPGWAVSERWLPGASLGAEQCGHFRRPLCLSLYPEERLQLYRVTKPPWP